MIDPKPKVSIIVPVYNVESYIKRCLDSIINQTYKNIEIILVNDGSTDRSGVICDEYAIKDSRIHVIHKENGGVTSARCQGTNFATGEWITFVDSDDTLPRNSIEILINSSEGVEIVRGTCFTDKKIQFSLSHKLSLISKEKCIKLILMSSFLPTLWGGLYKRILFANNDIFNIPFTIINGEDMLNLIKLILKTDYVKYINEIVYNYQPGIESAIHTFVLTYDYALIYDECLMLIFEEEDNMKIYQEEILMKRISILSQLISSPTMKMNNEYVERIKKNHVNTPKTIGQCITLFLAEMPYWLRKPLYFIYLKKNLIIS